MARKKRKTETLIDTSVKKEASVRVIDGFSNPFTKQGFGYPNPLEATEYPITRLTRNWNLMNALYRNSWLAKRIIDTIPKDMLRNWIKYTGEIKPEAITELQKAERHTQLKKTLERGLCWGRLYGGAVGLMLIDGQEDILDEPLDLDSIRPGDFKGLHIADRWQGVYPQIDLITDINSPEFGLPEYYQFADQTKRVIENVHHSRVIRFVGDELPYWEKVAEMYWGSSKIEAVFDELKKRDNTSANIAGLVFLSNLRIFKKENLAQMLTSQSVGAQQDFLATIQAINHLQNNFGMTILDKEDEFVQVAANFSGLHEIYECFMMDLAGATEIPVTKLFGRSPAGMNATGESDSRNYYGTIEQEQEAHLRPALEKLLPVFSLSTLGYIPDDLDFEFNPVQTPSDKELGEIVRYKTEAVNNAYDRGIIDRATALMEYKQMGEGTGMFSNVTAEMITEAENEPDLVLSPEEREKLLGGGKDEEDKEEKEE